MTDKKTKLGWVIQGVTSAAYSLSQTASFNCLGQLWELETIGIKDPAQKKKTEVMEREIMNFFDDTVAINKEGRYEVNLPWREDVNLLNNRTLALKRLHSTTKRLVSTGNYKEYDSSLKEWLHSGIIEQVQGDEDGHFLAHHPVIKESSLTTRVRPVFDASAKDEHGKSLNSSLEPGINLLELIPKLLLDFRMREYGVTADIKKAFLQISLAEADRKYLQFLWWANEDRHQLITYRHCRVVFGVTCSPFLLNATIRHHLESEYIPLHLKPTTDKLKQSFYVDNCLTSCSSVESLQEFINNSKELMLLAKMDLRGWVSGPSNEETVLSVLGLWWNTKTDDLKINAKSLKYNGERITTRFMLSLAHRVFDPIGFTSPVSLKAKLLLKQVHQRKLGWDEQVPEDIAKAFLKWVSKLDSLEDVAVPRRITLNSIHDSKLSVHIFYDASKDAYAASLFLRSESEGVVSVQLIAAKSRVSPSKDSKDISIPRLELLAAVIGVRLYVQFKNNFPLEHFCWFWTDSIVVLTWIQKNESLDVFVKNRVKEIRSYTNIKDWNHLPGNLNPADLPSRSCEADVLKESLWWNGPEWLKLDPKEWPISSMYTHLIKGSIEVNQQYMVNSAISDNFSERLLYFSKYTSIVRMIAWIYRCKIKKSERLQRVLSSEEITNAENNMFKLIQTETYGKLKTYKDLCTFVDTDDLIKVKTKLISENIPFCYRYPILLPSKHIIVEKLVVHKHRALMHAGTLTVIANLRQTLWITGIRLLVKKISRRCVICRKQKGEPFSTPLVALPEDRTQAGKPFQVTGVDLTGPLFLRSGEKIWLVLYTCAVYRAIHLEVVASLSTDEFLLSFRRFVARRGRPQTVYSDNGTNFVGAINLFKKINWNEVVSLSAIQKIDWILIPPGSPWWGGWWERLIRMIKEILRRVLGKAVLNLIELQTCITESEAVINSRPLSYITDEIDVLSQPLTPAIFLQPLPCTNVSDLDYLDGKSLNVRVRYLQKLRSDLKMRFCNEYLSLLVLKGKDRLHIPRIGEVVLVMTPEKRSLWPLGVVQELYKGKDGVCRVAKVKTQHGEYKRSVRCLYPLEGV